MRIELDLCLKDPHQTIDLSKIVKKISTNAKYSILLFNNEHFLLLKEMKNDLKYRIHKDGRFCINVVLNDDLSDFHNVITDLNLKIIDFIDNICEIEKSFLNDELNMYINGSSAPSFYWKNIDEINQLGEKICVNYNVRTFLFDTNCLFVKVSI